MPPSTAPAAPGAPSFDDLERRIVDHYFRLSPGAAVAAGLHDYDGRVPDLSRAATDAWETAARGRLAELAERPAPEPERGRRLDRLLLELLLEGPLFALAETREFERNPMIYVGPVSVTNYLSRAYAPAAVRARAILATFRAAPGLLAQGRARLDARLPLPFVQLAESMAGGIPAHLAEAEAFVAAEAPALRAEVAEASAAAGAAVADFLARLRAEYLPRAVPEFALGPALFQRLLWVREGITLPFAELKARGLADLRRNQARLAAIGRAHRPPRTPQESVDAVFADHPDAAGLVPRARTLVAETRAFCVAQDLVTIPVPDVCRVEETPSYGRSFSTASLSPPGPFEVGEEGIYYITPVDPAWTPQQAEEWLRSFGDGMLRNITVHEVYPGHYVQFLHFRRSAGSLARKVFISDAFTEGWAHYAEQLAVERGIDGGSDRAAVAQLHDALLRDVRLLAAIGMHTEGRDLAWATRLFEEEAFLEHLPAEREALRGTYNPDYYCYTLGKLAILEARDRFLGPRFGGSLRAFHDALLAFGCPPVGRLEELLGAA